MAKNYVLAHVHRGNEYVPTQVVYLTELGCSYRWGSVDEAIRFDLEELFELLKNSSLGFLGFCVIRIEDVTFEVFKKDKDLVEKFRRVDYALR